MTLAPGDWRQGVLDCAVDRGNPLAQLGTARAAAGQHRLIEGKSARGDLAVARRPGLAHEPYPSVSRASTTVLAGWVAAARIQCSSRLCSRADGGPCASRALR